MSGGGIRFPNEATPERRRGRDRRSSTVAAPTWLPGSYDATLDLVYWAIGNPCPDINGEERLGDNLYTSSVVALSPKTGAMKWYYQFSPHDTHDWDAVQPMLLVDEVWQGKPRKLLMQGNRNGMFYVLDRTNGQFLLADKLSSKVTWLKGFTKEGKPIVDPASIASREGSAVCPGLGGGANWPPASYNPHDEAVLYARVRLLHHLHVLRRSARQQRHPLVGSRHSQSAGASRVAGIARKAIRPANSCARWIRSRARRCGIIPTPRSGVLSTAGGLVFTSGVGGLLALDARTGKPVWNLNIVSAARRPR